MKLIKNLIVTAIIMVLFLTLFTAQASAYELQKKYVASDAKWLIHLDFKAFIKTRLWDNVYREKKIKINHRNDHFLKEVSFDVLKDLNSVTVYGVDKGDKNAVVLINGVFNISKVIEKLKSEEKPEISKYGKVKVYHWDNDDYGAFVGNNLLIITHSRINMEYAIDVVMGKKQGFEGSALSKRMKEVPGDAILFALAGDLSRMIGNKHNMPMMIDKSKMALFLAMERNNDLRLTLKLHTESPEAAKNLMQVGNGLLALARMNGEKMDGKEKLINSINITSNGNIVIAKMFVPSEFIIKNIDKH